MSEIKKAIADLNGIWGAGNVRTPKQEIGSSFEAVVDLINRLNAITPPDEGTAMFIETAVRNLRTARGALERADRRLK